MFKKSFLVLLVGLGIMFLVGCESYYEIPAGRHGKMLTPKGFTGEWKTPGMTDLGTESTNGLQNRLVTLEITTVQIKEGFGKVGEDSEDHRILTKNKVPVTVDVYVRVKVIEEKKDFILEQITPTKINDRVSDINAKSIYDRFACMDVRAGTREILSKYEDADEILADLGKASKLCEAMVKAVFVENGVPLEVQNVKVSNVKMDDVYLKAKNSLSTVQTKVAEIDSIGKALERNPAYKLWLYKEIAEKTGTTFVIGDVPIAVVPNSKK